MNRKLFAGSMAIAAALVVFVPRTVHAADTKIFTAPFEKFSLRYPADWLVSTTRRKTGFPRVVTDFLPSKADQTKDGAKRRGYQVHVTKYKLSELGAKDRVALLTKGWTPFVQQYENDIVGSANALRAKGTVPVKIALHRPGYLASSFRPSGTEAGMTSNEKFVLVTKDKKTIYVIQEGWTQRGTPVANPYEAEFDAFVQSFRIL